MRFSILIASVRALVRWRRNAGRQFPHHSIRYQQHIYRRCAHECNHNGSGTFRHRCSPVNSNPARDRLRPATADSTRRKADIFPHQHHSRSHYFEAQRLMRVMVFHRSGPSAR
jgi:hypothetical protein